MPEQQTAKPPAKKTAAKRTAKKTTPQTDARSALDAETGAEPGPYEEFEPEPTGMLSRRGRVIRDALVAVGLPVLPEASDDVWALLAAPFPADEIEKLPKQVSRDDSEKGRCEAGTRFTADGHTCGGWHARSVHLDYVGHAGITMRLNDVVGPAGWDYEPYTHTPDGLPLFGNGTFAARLTILGVSKWDMAANYNGVQEAYGDALRRCAMRFGIGTELWSKSERARATLDPTTEPAPPVPPGPTIEDLLARLDAAAVDQDTTREAITAKWREQHGDLAPGMLPMLAPMTLAPLVESIEAWIAAQRAQNPS